MAFETATYTDVSAEEAIDGVDGFNFQAVSPGLTGVDRQRIRESMLHRVVPSWALNHDPLSHPPTCAYVVAEGRNYLSRGRSTGSTNSGRPGNQITQAIVTSDPDDFVPYRPAQLFGATEWALEKASRPEAEPWVTPLKIREDFEAAALAEYISRDGWASSALPHYLTMLEAATAVVPKKLVLLHSDLDVVMRWIALGSLFLDAEAARALEFRALVDDPWRAGANVVGVSPDFEVGDLGAANVLDLAGRTVPRLEPTESAQVWAGWFLGYDTDEALAAIEIARRWEPGLGERLALKAAAVVAIRDAAAPGNPSWRTALASVQALATAGMRDDLTLYAEEFCDAAHTYLPQNEEEFELAGSAIRLSHGLDVDEVATGVLLPTLEALRAAPDAGGGFAREIAVGDAPLDWGTSLGRDAASAYLGQVLNDVPSELLPDMFAAARLIGVSVPEDKLRSAVARLSELWLRNPDLGRGAWDRWLEGGSVLASTTAGLLRAWSAGDEPASSDLRDGRWDFLAGYFDDPRVLGWIDAGGIARLAKAERARAVAAANDVPADAWSLVLAGTELPADSALWAAFIMRCGLNTRIETECRRAIASAARGVPANGESRLAGDWSPLMASLRNATDGELAKFAVDFAYAHTAFRTAREDVRARSDARLDACIRYANLAPLFRIELAWLLLNSTNAGEVARLLSASSPWGREALHAALIDLVDAGHGVRAADHALRLRHVGANEAAEAADEILGWIAEARPDVVAQVRQNSSLRKPMESFLRELPSDVQSRSRRSPFGWSKER